MVGIPSSLRIRSTSALRPVVQTFGSMILQSSSSYVVSVMDTTHFVFRLILFNKSRSHRIKSDFV